VDGNDRPLLVFAHYFGGSGRSWSPLLRALGGDFECIAPDLPGFGGTPALAGGPALSSYIRHFSELAGGRPWMAVGHSMGGKIALGAAARSALLKALILIAPSPPTPEPMTRGEREKTLASFGKRDAATTQVRKNSNDALPNVVFDSAVDDLMRVDESAWRWWLERGSREDISNLAAVVAAPTLVLFGDHDQVLGSKVAIRVAGDLSDARAAMVVGGGHFVPMEQPEIIAGRIRAFVSSLSAGG
jgi:pimeloyl-ACP methyl ester carboxylesterase